MKAASYCTIFMPNLAINSIDVVQIKVILTLAEEEDYLIKLHI